jgi:hypothetical protein
MWKKNFFFFLSLRVDLRTLSLQSRLSTTWATPQVHFALVILEMGVSNYLPGLALNLSRPVSASQVARVTGVSHLQPAWIGIWW